MRRMVSEKAQKALKKIDATETGIAVGTIDSQKSVDSQDTPNGIEYARIEPGVVEVGESDDAYGASIKAQTVLTPNGWYKPEIAMEGEDGSATLSVSKDGLTVNDEPVKKYLHQVEVYCTLSKPGETEGFLTIFTFSFMSTNGTPIAATSTAQFLTQLYDMLGRDNYVNIGEWHSDYSLENYGPFRLAMSGQLIIVLQTFSPTLQSFRNESFTIDQLDLKSVSDSVS